MKTSHSTIWRWIKNPIPKQRKKVKALKSDAIVNMIRSSIIANPLTSICDLKEMVKDVLGLDVSKELIRVAIAKMNFTKKKVHFYGQPKNLQEKTNNFINLRNTYLREGKEFFAIDETSFGRNGVVTQGYSPKGKRLFVRKRLPRITTETAIVCVTRDNIIGIKRHVGSVNRTTFLQFLHELDIPKGAVVLMDNVSFHHCITVTNFLSERGINILYTPPYSPWFNPIEMCFSVVKRSYYKNKSIEQAFCSLTKHHLGAFFEKSLYTDTPI
jgi:transposase